MQKAINDPIKRTSMIDPLMPDLYHLVPSELVQKLTRTKEVVRDHLDSLINMMNVIVILITVLMIIGRCSTSGSSH
jgi:hypothetical protein